VSGTLSRRTAIVTGAASGIGLAIAARLIHDGAAVFAAVRSKEDLERVYEHAAIAAGFVGELHQTGAADDLVATAVEALGHVDVLVNNAGGGVILPTLEHTEDSLRATVDNNLWTTIYCVRAVLPHMMSRGHGRIVNIGADSVRTGLMDHAMYNAAKGGVHAMVTGLAREFATSGITANTVAPCYVRTPELAELLESGQAPSRLQRVVEEGTGIVPLGRPGDPDEVAAVVAFLAGEDSRFITGQTIYVNGGSSMG
jgi:2,3-dihydroxy-2,3-dihydro-p-cumate dehydrogenase